MCHVSTIEAEWSVILDQIVYSLIQIHGKGQLPRLDQVVATALFSYDRTRWASMGVTWSKPPAPPDVLSVNLGKGGEEPFVQAVEIQIKFAHAEKETLQNITWRVIYEVDIADLRQQHVLFEMEAVPLRYDQPHLIKVPSCCFQKLLDETSADRLCNVSALFVLMLDKSGIEIMRFSAVMEVYQMDSRAKLQVASLRRRIYAPLSPS